MNNPCGHYRQMHPYFKGELMACAYPDCPYGKPAKGNSTYFVVGITEEPKFVFGVFERRVYRPVPHTYENQSEESWLKLADPGKLWDGMGPMAHDAFLWVEVK